MHRCLLTALITLLSLSASGCANLKNTYYYEPVKSDGWTEVARKTGLLEFGTYPPNITTRCGDTAITLESAGHVVVAIIGPPLIPLLPFGEGMADKAVLGFRIESPDNKTKLSKAELVVDGIKAEPVEKLQFEVPAESFSDYRYSYKINWRNVKSFQLQMETTDAACGTITVPYRQDYHGTYSMLGF